MPISNVTKWHGVVHPSSLNIRKQILTHLCAKGNKKKTFALQTVVQKVINSLHSFVLGKRAGMTRFSRPWFQFSTTLVGTRIVINVLYLFETFISVLAH